MFTCFEQRTVFTQQGLAKALGQMMGTFTMRLKCVPQYDPSRSFHADPRSYICYWKLYDYAYTHRSKLATPSMKDSVVVTTYKTSQLCCYINYGLGSVESNRSRYGNIGVLVLTVASAPIHPLSFVKSISSPPTRMKRVSTASPSRLPIFLPSGSLEIYLVSQGNIDGCRAVLFRVTGSLASIRFPPPFKSLPLGYFNVCLDYLKLFRAVVSKIQVKIIYGSLSF
ncbi:hypothetical protein F2Q68_00005676 [Brassica cretica]|uniref:Uncharacterized protein n=1 Tax=Brassica cretica TaxID=69181 RepID=A0A8S9JJ21_BRACR|nr:hypothetical protein F2Q68_00005676 [Brassica cretica]